MSKHKSLFFQFQTACPFVKGFDKHSDKRQEHNTGHIVKSLSSKTALLDFAKQFTDYIKAEYPTVKKVSAITPSMAQSFIDKKCSEGCSIETIKTYQSYLNKFECGVRNCFNSKVSYHTEVKKDLVQERVTIKQYSFTDSEIKRILDVKKISESYRVVLFNSFTGCRINTCEKLLVRDLHIVGDKVYVYIRRDKGGRDRTICIESKEFVAVCRDFRSGKNPNDKVFNIKGDSVNKWLRNRCKALNIRTPEGLVKSGNHSIRKNFAEHCAARHGIGKTMEHLGHGKCRPDLEETYLHSKK